MYPHRNVNLDNVDGGQVEEGPGMMRVVDHTVSLK